MPWRVEPGGEDLLPGPGRADAEHDRPIAGAVAGYYDTGKLARRQPEPAVNQMAERIKASLVNLLVDADAEDHGRLHRAVSADGHAQKLPRRRRTPRPALSGLQIELLHEYLPVDRRHGKGER